MNTSRVSKHGRRSAEPKVIALHVDKHDEHRFMKAASTMAEAATAVATVVSGTKA